MFLGTITKTWGDLDENEGSCVCGASERTCVLIIDVTLTIECPTAPAADQILVVIPTLSYSSTVSVDCETGDGSYTITPETDPAPSGTCRITDVLSGEIVSELPGTDAELTVEKSSFECMWSLP